MNKDFLIVPSIIEAISTRKDKGLTVRIATNEIGVEEKAILMGLHSNYAYVAFKSIEFDAEEKELVENLDVDEKEFGQKTHSQRLRAVLFLLWRQENENKPTHFQIPFNTFYAKKMEEIITHFKSKLDA